MAQKQIAKQQISEQISKKLSHLFFFVCVNNLNKMCAFFQKKNIYRFQNIETNASAAI